MKRSGRAAFLEIPFKKVRVIDILSVANGFVTDIWMISDELGVLMQLGKVTLT